MVGFAIGSFKFQRESLTIVIVFVCSFLLGQWNIWLSKDNRVENAGRVATALLPFSLLMGYGTYVNGSNGFGFVAIFMVIVSYLGFFAGASIVRINIGIPKVFLAVAIGTVTAGILCFGIWPVSSIWINDHLLAKNLPGNVGLRMDNPERLRPLSYLDGHKFSFDDIKGRPSIFEFWASYCGPCYRKLEVLDKMNLDSVNVVVVGIGEHEDIKKIQKLRDEKHYKFTFLYDKGGALFKSLGPKSIPFEIIVDRNGEIVDQMLGFSEDISRIYSYNLRRKLIELSGDD